ELLGFPTEARMLCTYGNAEVSPTVKWHPKGDRAAIDMVLGRKVSTLWIWIHKKGLRELRVEEMKKVLGLNEDDVLGGGGLFTEIGDWNVDDLDFTFSYVESK